MKNVIKGFLGAMIAVLLVSATISNNPRFKWNSLDKILTVFSSYDNEELIYQRPVLLENEGTITTTDIAGVLALDKTFTVPRTGQYIIQVSAAANGDATGSDWIVEATLNGQNLDPTRLEIEQVECKDVAGNVNGTFSRQSYNVVSVTTNQLNLSNTLQIRVRPEVDGVEASIWNLKVRIETIENYDVQ